MWELGLFVFVGGLIVFLVGGYWLSSSKRSSYHSHETMKQDIREHEQMKERARIEDSRRRMRRWRRR